MWLDSYSAALNIAQHSGERIRSKYPVDIWRLAAYCDSILKNRVKTG